MDSQNDDTKNNSTGNGAGRDKVVAWKADLPPDPELDRQIVEHAFARLAELDPPVRPDPALARPHRVHTKG